jgi:hypothetical protein
MGAVDQLVLADRAGVHAAAAESDLGAVPDGGDVELRPAADGGLEAVVGFTHATRAVRWR